MSEDPAAPPLPDTGKGRAADNLFDHFAAQIKSGMLKEGEPLPPEREIVDTFGVSRTVVREALSALASRGLIEARPRFRPVVRRASFDAALETVESLISRLLVTPGDVRNLFDTRILLEAALARQAALQATDAHLTEMQDALEANRMAVRDNETFFRTDIAFHEVLYRIPANPIIAAMHRGYSTWLAPQWSIMARDETRNARNHKAHAAIFAAISARDPDRAEQALRNHLEDAWLQVRETFD